MGEFWEEAFKFYNFPLTLLMGVVGVFWVLTVFGVFDTDSFEPDIDADIDVDIDVDADVDVDADAHVHHVEGSSSGLWLMRAFGLGDVPLMVLLSVLIFSMWSIAIFSNYYLNSGGSTLLALVFIIPNFIASLFVMKFVTMPFRPLFRALKTDPDAPEPVIGRTGTVRSSEVTESFGQIEVSTKGTPLYLNARIAPKDEPLKRGDEALIYRYLKDDGVYLVRKSTLIESVPNSNEEN